MHRPALARRNDLAAKDAHQEAICTETAGAHCNSYVVSIQHAGNFYNQLPAVHAGNFYNQLPAVTANLTRAFACDRFLHIYLQQ